MKQKLLTLFTFLVIAVTGAWSKDITWNTADNSTNSDVALSSNAIFTGDDGTTTLTYANPNGCKKLKNGGGLYMNGASQWNNSTAQRHFTFKAPSSAGTVSITFAAINSKTDGTGSATVRIYGGTTVAYDVNTLNTSLTSPTIAGLQAGTSDVIITFSAKCTIKEVKWTDVAAPTYTTVYANDFTATPMGAATVSYTNMAPIASDITGWIGWASEFEGGVVSSSSSCKATLSFATPLELASNGVDRGRIRVYWGHSSNSKTLGLKVNGTAVAFDPTTVANTLYPKVLNIAEYTIPEETTSISSIEPSGSSSSGTYLFRIEVLTYAAAPGTIVFSPAAGSVETGSEITLSSANAETIKYQWGSAVVGSDGNWSSATTYGEENKPKVPAVGSEDNVLSVWAHNDKDDTYGSATYTIVAAKTPVTLAYTPSSATITGGDELTQPVLSATGADIADIKVAGAISYESSAPTVASVDADGVITPLKNGTATITASISGNETYSDASATFELTINENTSYSQPYFVIDGVKYENGDTYEGLVTGKTITIQSDDEDINIYSNWSTSGTKGVSDYYNDSNKRTTGVNTFGTSTSTGGNRYLYAVTGTAFGHSELAKLYFPGVVASDPVFSVESGYLAKDATVNISTLDKSDVVYYTVTTDGSEPADPTKESTKIVDDTKTNANLNIFTAVGTYKIKARAFAKDNADHGSAIVSREYTVTEDELVSVPVTKAKYATFASDYDLDFSSVDGLYAYTATASSNTITFNKVTGSVKAGDGLLLYADVNTATTFNVPVATNSPSAVEGNKLVRGTGEAVSTDGTTSGSYNYVLSNNGGVIAFYYANGKTVGTNKAYLKDITASASKISLPFNDDETTAIDNITISQYGNDAPMYNMAGQRVSESYKGVVIQNGKKYIRK